MTGMKPASETAIVGAINLIFQDIAVQNPNWCAVTSELQPSLGIGIGLENLDSQVQVLSETLRAVESHFQSRISQIRKCCNKISLIHHLPVEVLAEIIRYAAWDSSYTTDYYRRLGSLSRVCILWASIIDQSPTLWTTVYSKVNPLLVDKIISRSGKCPLSIHKLPYTNCQTSGRFLQQVCPQVHRWKTAELALQNQEIAHLQEYLADASAPQLEKLRVSVNHLVGALVGARVDISPGGMERLEELDLSGLSIHGASPLLSRLKVLRLNYLGEGTGATTAHILTVLAQCPELTDLQVSNCDIHDPEAPDLPARLELPHLRVLSFRNNTPSGASSSLLSRISTPKYDRFCLDTHYATGLPSHQLLESISHVVPSLAHLVASARCVVIDLDDYRCRYSAHHSSMGQTLELSVDHSSPLTVLGWITTVFGNAMKTVRAEVTICYDSSESPPDSCLPAISRIPLMTSLTLMGQDDQTPIIQHLSTATLVNGKQQWPFPRLASLSIEEDANDPGAILGMVESRYGHTIKSKKAKSKARLPAPFTSFVISGSGKTMDDHTYRQIRKIVGDDNVRREIEEDEEDEDDDYYYGGGCRYGPHSDDEAMSFSDEGYY